MTAHQDPQPPLSTPPAPTWSAEARTWASLLLFVHLFVLLVAVTSYTRPSALQQRLHDLFGTYLRNLHLTPLPASYPFARFHLTHATDTDVDFAVEVDVERADGSTETVTIPPTPIQPLVRFRRYQALANATGTLASGELGDWAPGILPKAIAGSVLRRQQATGGAIRVQALGLPEMEDLASFEAVARAAREKVSNVYDAQVIISPTSVELLRKSTTLEVAPAQSAPADSRPGEP